MAFRTSVSAAGVTTAVSTVTIPAGVVATDVLVIGWCRPVGTAPTLTPSTSGSGTFTSLTGSSTASTATNMYYSGWVGTGFAAGDTVTITASTSGFPALLVSAYSGVQLTGDVVGTFATRGASSTTITAATVTTPAANSEVVALFLERLGAGSTSVTISGGATSYDAFQPATSSTYDCTAATASYIQSTAGASSTITATYPSASSNAAAVQVALQPSATGTPASGTATLTLTASGTATGPGTTGAAALTLTASGTAQAATTGAAALTLTATGTGTIPATPVLTSARVGGLTTGGFSVNADTTNVASGVRIAVSTSSGMTSPTYNSGSRTAPDSNGLVTLAVTGLTAGTDYWWQVELDGTLTGPVGKAHTFPSGSTAGSYSFIVGSCQASGVNPGVFDNARARTNPTSGHTALFGVHLGDLHYDDISTHHAGSQSLALNLASFRNQFAQSKLAQFMREIPQAVTMSDHDYGADNTDGADANGQYYLAAYRATMPHYPLVPDSNGDTGLSGGALGIYQTWTVGRVCFILTDGRSYMDPITQTDNSSKTKLGATQKAWLKAIALAAVQAGRVVVWLHEDGWNNNGTFTGDDTWSAYTTERAEIGTYFTANGIASKLLYINGDWHVLTADDGTNNPWGGFPMITCSPWQQTTFKGTGPYSQGYHPNPTSSSVANQYGWFDVTDSGSSVTIAFTGYDATTGTDSSAITLSKTFTVTQAATGTAALTLSASGAARTPAAGAAAITLTATATATAASAGTAAITLAATGAGSAVGAGTAAITLTSQGTATAPVTGTAALTVSAGAAATAPTAGSSALTFTASGTGTGPNGGAGTAALTLTATGTAHAAAAGTATVTLTAAGTTVTLATGNGALTFTATGTAQAPASGTAALTFTATGSTGPPPSPAGLAFTAYLDGQIPRFTATLAVQPPVFAATLQEQT